MTELIKITENNGSKAVSARELHVFLESKQEFAHWIKSRIDKYGLIENQDFEVFDNFIKNPDGGRPLKEYILKVDTAKELAMVEGNEKGKLARLYFIEMEKVAKKPTISNDEEERMYLELTSLIRRYLQRGDIKEVAVETGLGEKTLGLVAKGMKAKPKFIQALYQKALENKSTGKFLDVREMINQLK